MTELPAALGEAVEKALLDRLERMPPIDRALLSPGELKRLGLMLTTQVHRECPWAREHVEIKAAQDRAGLVEFSMRPTSATGAAIVEALRAVRGEEWDEVTGLPYCPNCGTKDDGLLAAGKDGVCSVCVSIL